MSKETNNDSQPTIGVILQARMGSQRLPGKVLRPIAGRPMLEWCLLRLGESKRCSRVIIATSTAPQDEVIVHLCEQFEAPYFRGSENDVLSRYYEAARHFRVDPVIRVTSDCPLIDPQVLDALIDAFAVAKVDYMSNTLNERTFPLGLDAEIFSFAALEQAHHLATKPYEREHVTPYLYQHPQQFRLKGYKNSINLSHFRVTVDTQEDLRLADAIYAHFIACGMEHRFSLDELIEFLSMRPELVEINRHVRQKQLGE
ncbi:MAG: cytidylyltransferase domain-containing protein [bacterium]